MAAAPVAGRGFDAAPMVVCVIECDSEVRLFAAPKSSLLTPLRCRAGRRSDAAQVTGPMPHRSPLRCHTDGRLNLPAVSPFFLDFSAASTATSLLLPTGSLILIIDACSRHRCGWMVHYKLPTHAVNLRYCHRRSRMLARRLAWSFRSSCGVFS